MRARMAISSLPRLHLAAILLAARDVAGFAPPLTQVTPSRPVVPRAPTALRRREPVLLLDVSVALFEAQVGAEALVSSQLQHLTPLSGLVLYGAGLLTAVSPCCLSMLPLTTAVIAGLEQQQDATALTRLKLPAAFAMGLASALSLFGVAAALSGRLYGQVSGAGLAPVVAVLSGVMGLNLLQIVPLQFPSVTPQAIQIDLPPVGKAYVFGAASALASSPCASPVLVSILGFVSQTQDPVLGAGLLLMYSLGSTSLVLLAGVLTGATLGTGGALRGLSEWATPVAGATLLMYATYTGLGVVFPSA